MPSSSSRSPVIRLHGYDILADVGVRPTAQVYKVRPKLHEDVPAYMDDEEPCYALKCIDLSEHSLPTEGKQRAVRETQALLKLQHTNIARYHKAFLSEGLLCVMSEFAEAGTLHHLIYTLKERGQRLSADLTWHLFIQICHGLKKLHDCSIIHRALKTRNLLLFPETLYAHPQLKYRCKLADLGIPELQRHLRLSTLSGSTLRYLAPEVLGKQPQDEKVDVWALGCVLYEMATLSHAFNSTSAIQRRVRAAPRVGARARGAPPAPPPRRPRAAAVGRRDFATPRRARAHLGDAVPAPPRLERGGAPALGGGGGGGGSDDERRQRAPAARRRFALLGEARLRWDLAPRRRRLPRRFRLLPRAVHRTELDRPRLVRTPPARPPRAPPPRAPPAAHAAVAHSARRYDGIRPHLPYPHDGDGASAAANGLIPGFGKDDTQPKGGDPQGALERKRSVHWSDTLSSHGGSDKGGEGVAGGSSSEPRKEAPRVSTMGRCRRRARAPSRARSRRTSRAPSRGRTRRRIRVVDRRPAAQPRPAAEEGTRRRRRPPRSAAGGAAAASRRCVCCCSRVSYEITITSLFLRSHSRARHTGRCTRRDAQGVGNCLAVGLTSHWEARGYEEVTAWRPLTPPSPAVGTSPPPPPPSTTCPRSAPPPSP